MHGPRIRIHMQKTNKGREFQTFFDRSCLYISFSYHPLLNKLATNAIYTSLYRSLSQLKWGKHALYHVVLMFDEALRLNPVSVKDKAFDSQSLVPVSVRGKWICTLDDFLQRWNRSIMPPRFSTPSTKLTLHDESFGKPTKTILNAYQ